MAVNTKEYPKLIAEGVSTHFSQKVIKTTDENKPTETAGYRLQEHGLLTPEQDFLTGVNLALSHTQRSGGCEGHSGTGQTCTTPTWPADALLCSHPISPGREALVSHLSSQTSSERTLHSDRWAT